MTGSILLDLLSRVPETDSRSLPSARRTHIHLIFNKGRPGDNVTNYHAISLLNLDARIISLAIYSHLLSVIDLIIDVDQTGFLLGRNPGSNISTPQLAIADEFFVSGILSQVEFGKAYDRTTGSSVHYNLVRRSSGQLLLRLGSPSSRTPLYVPEARFPNISHTHTPQQPISSCQHDPSIRYRTWEDVDEATACLGDYGKAAASKLDYQNVYCTPLEFDVSTTQRKGTDSSRLRFASPVSRVTTSRSPLDATSPVIMFARR